MRTIAILFGFLMVFIGYMDRINIGVAAIQITKDYTISVAEIGAISSSFFFGYALLQIPGGIWSERLGPRRVLTAAFSWWSLFTILTAAGASYLSFLLIRFAFGWGEGPLFPGVSNLYGRWLRKDELTSGWGLSIIGIPLGGLVGTSVALGIMNALGWQWIFIIYGIIGFLIVIGFFVLMRDMPESVSWIKKDEIEEINSSYKKPEERGKTIKVYAPWRTLLKSGRFWAWGFSHAMLNFPLYSFLTFLPLYLEDYRHFAKSSLTLAASLPWALLLISCILSGYFMDRAIKHGATLFKAHALPDSISFFLSGIFILVGAFVSSPVLAIILLSIGLAFMGPELTLSFAITTRMGGEYSGSYSGWLNFIANSIGAIVPIVTGLIVAAYNWPAALTFVALGAFIGGVLWLIIKPDKSFAPNLIPNYTPTVTVQR
ncbi:MFS transporter [Thermoplasmatales archaeon AK]|nr:MFS transporter [Thermoplasmatales archaeon AK]